MGYFIFLGVIVVLIFLGYSFSKKLLLSKSQEDITAGKVGKKLCLFGGIGLIIVITIFTSYTQIEVGHVGIVYTFGDITGQVPEGPNFIAPWSSVVEANIKTTSEAIPELACFSSETQKVAIDVIVNYSISASNIQNLYRTVGPNFLQVILYPRIAQIFKDETVKYASVEIAPNREKIRNDSKMRIEEECRSYSIEIVDVILSDIKFEPAFEQAIEQKQVATQNALEEEQKVQVEKHRADQKIEAARGEGESILVVAQKQAEANRELSSSLNSNIIAYESIQKLNPNVQVMLLPAGQSVILPQEFFKK